MIRHFLTTILCALIIAACSTDSTYRTYYLDATNGDDSHSGISPDKAWKNLSKVKSIQWKAGDQLLLKRGSKFIGELDITAHGTQQTPVIVGAYGEGDLLPCIIGNDSSRYAMRVYNSDYVTIRDLEIVNTGKERLAGRSGLRLEADNYGMSYGIRVDHVTVRDVNGSLVKSQGGGCGINIVCRGREKLSAFYGLTIENCHILRCARNAMIWSETSWDRKRWFPSKHTVVRGNLIEGVPGDGIVPIACDSTLIEYNVMRDCPELLPPSEAAAGFWPWSCDNTIIQFNEVSDHKAPWDAQGYDSDYNSTNTVIRYNYSHDNYGGLVLICTPNENPRNIGNHHTRVQYNISINDGIRPGKTRSGMFSPIIHMGGPSKDSWVERNILHQNKKPSADIDRRMIVADSWAGYPDSIRICENVFYAAETSSIDMTKSTNYLFEGNIFLGKYSKLPTDAKARTQSAYYKQTVLDIDPLGYKGLYQLMNARPTGGFEGHFVDKSKIEAFFEKLLNE